MENKLMLVPTGLINKMAITEIIKCNDITLRFGLKLSQAEARELVETRDEALNSFGRIEFAGGVINKLIMKFCNSPYLSQFNYASTLHDLLETFYYFKNETLDELSDDELLALMKHYFDHSCQGSVELLQNRELEVMARNIRYGINDYSTSDDDRESYDGEEYEEYE